MCGGLAPAPVRACAEPLPPTPSPKRRGGEKRSGSPSPLRGGGWGEGFSVLNSPLLLLVVQGKVSEGGVEGVRRERAVSAGVIADLPQIERGLLGRREGPGTGHRDAVRSAVRE